MSNVDVNDLEVFDQVVEVTEEGDVKQAEDFFVPALPDDGDHLTVLAVQESKGVTLERQKDKNNQGKKTGAPYVMANFAFALELESGKKAFVFDNPTSIQRGTGMSALEAVMILVDERIPSGLSYKQVKDHVELVAQQTPEIIITTEWQAQIQDPKTGNWKTIKRGQRNFPQVENPEDGSFSFVPEIEFEGQTVRAVAKVIRYKPAR